MNLKWFVSDTYYRYKPSLDYISERYLELTNLASNKMLGGVNFKYYKQQIDAMNIQNDFDQHQKIMDYILSY